MATTALPSPVDVHSEGLRQLERAERLAEAASSQGRRAATQGRSTAVHKSLEQLFGEARAQRLERDVAEFSLATQAEPCWTASWGAKMAEEPRVGTVLKASAKQQDVDPSVGLQEFFGFRHERVIVEAVEESYRDCLRCCERHSFDRLTADWEDDGSRSAVREAQGDTGLEAMLLAHQQCPQLQLWRVWDVMGMACGCSHSTSARCLAQREQVAQMESEVPFLAQHDTDAAIIDALTSEPLSPQLVQRIAHWSAASCPAYQAELKECWSILSYELKMTLQSITGGAIKYLQTRYFEEMKSLVYNHVEAALGGHPDAWSLVRAHGRLKFQTAAFPSNVTHVWYAAYVAARSGLSSLLVELPDKAGPCSERAMLRPVCLLLAKRLQAIDPSQTSEMAGSQIDSADLLRADVEETSGFQDVLVSLLLGRGFAFGRLPEGTVEDWLWFRLHLAPWQALDDDQSPEFKNQLEKLRYQAASLGPSHFDTPDRPSRGASGLGLGLVPSNAMQSLNSVKVFLLTAQFGLVLQQLQLQDRSLRGVALHMALLLRRSGAFDAVKSLEAPVDVSAFLCDYASNFASRDQLQYFRALDVSERVQALQRLLLRGAAGDELLGYIDPNGRHRPGLLEQTLQEDGGEQSEFVELCSKAGRQAAEQGQYREAIRLLHLGRCYSEVLQVLCRCLCLPIWREQDNSEAIILAQDIQRFFDIYERNLDRYALSSQVWAIARKLYATRMFHSFCDRGEPENALDVFDREQLLCWGAPEAEDEPEISAEYPRIVADYIRVLNYAASRGAMAAESQVFLWVFFWKV
ncbi:unnamed protein product [Durusdinium trenchii]|uniref:Nuclear pore protein n=1 Tax=Durusdinium trenchii TaxID=1381693 RepID=A0ABP0SCS4_9DINO